VGADGSDGMSGLSSFFVQRPREAHAPEVFISQSWLGASGDVTAAEQFEVSEASAVSEPPLSVGPALRVRHLRRRVFGCSECHWWAGSFPEQPNVV